MSNFSDAEDRCLVQSALPFELSNNPVSWSAISKRMPHWKGQKDKLRYRLKTLKARFGNTLSAFPARYFQSMQMLSRTPRDFPTSTPEQSQVASFLHPDKAQLVEHRTQGSQELSRELSSEVIRAMFDHVSTADVHQESGRMELNMGEISVHGVTKLISVCLLKREDVFLDVGAGIDNILSQVSLQARVKKLIGIEVRPHVAAIGRAAIAAQLPTYPQLERVSLLHADVRDPRLIHLGMIESTTVLYSFNQVFEADANLKLESLCRQLLQLRLGVVSTSFFPRHQFRKSCSNTFCKQWVRRQEVPVDVTFRSKPVLFSVYERR